MPNTSWFCPHISTVVSILSCVILINSSVNGSEVGFSSIFILFSECNWYVHIKISRPWHSLTFGARSFFLVLCTVGCLAASLTSTPQMPGDPHTELWQSEMSPDIAKCPLGQRSPPCKNHWYTLSKMQSSHLPTFLTMQITCQTHTGNLISCLGFFPLLLTFQATFPRGCLEAPLRKPCSQARDCLFPVMFSVSACQRQDLTLFHGITCLPDSLRCERHATITCRSSRGP